MSKVSVFDHGWIDLVFEGRNQSYGAYQLRRQDARTTMLALFSGIALMGALVAIPIAINYLKDDVAIIDPPALPDTGPVVVHPVDLPKELPKPDPIKPSGGTPIKDPTVAFTPLVAATTPVTDPPTTDVVQNTVISTVTSEGNPNGSVMGTTTSPTSGTGTGEGVGPGTEPGLIDANFVDIAPLYPGGMDKFYKDVAKKFTVPELGTQQKIRVFVSFVVEPDGTLSNIKALNKPGHNLDKEAERVLRSLKAKWKPGIKGGTPVRTSYKLPIIVEVH